MTDRLAEIRARLDAATPGPWRAADWDDARGIRVVVGEFPRDPYTLALAERDHDARFIAHAPTDIAWLLDEVARLREYAVHKHNDCWQSGKCECGLEARNA